MKKIACFSASGGKALENFNKTVANKISLRDLESLEINDSYESVSVWGMRDTERNKSLWGKLNVEDTVLFYCKKKFISQGKIITTQTSSLIAQNLWGNSTYKFLIVMEPHKIIDSSRHKFWDAFNYSNYATIQGLMIPRRDLQEQVFKKFEGMDKFLNYALN